MKDSFDLMWTAIQHAHSTLRAADAVSTDLARMLKGRLRQVCGPKLLSALKQELRDYNAHTGKWRDEL